MVGKPAHMSLIGRYLHRRFERGVRSVEQRLGGAPLYKFLLRYVFPDHWSFLLGAIALYSFLVLVARALQRSDAHPLLGWEGTVVRRAPGGAVQRLSPDSEPQPAAADPPVGTPSE